MYEVLRELENIISRVAKEEVAEKMIICERAARWQDSKVMDKINLRREVYKKVIMVRKILGRFVVSNGRRLKS